MPVTAPLERTFESAAAARTAPAVAMRGIVKRFGSVVADDHVDFELAPGEIHALLGENGAGKTTLMNMLFGMFAPDEGEIRVDGRSAILDSPRDALALGIGMVHQHFMLVEQFTVSENVVVGSRPAWNMRLRRAEIAREVAVVAERYGIRIETTRPVGELSIDAQQRVEILKLLYRGARTLILDEPTAVLGPAETNRLFDVLRELRSHGSSVVIITHKLGEVMRLADRVTVLRAGRRVAHGPTAQFDEPALAQAMIGAALPQRAAPRLKPGRTRETLRVVDLTVQGDQQQETVSAVSFAVYSGEVVGIAGVEGNGQAELCEAVSGLRTPSHGAIEVDGNRLRAGDVREFYAHGGAVISADRLRWDLITELTLSENLALSAVREGRYSRCGLLNRRALRRDAERLLTEFDIRPADPDLPAASLSGGNQQKLVIARECAREPTILVASQPTRGLDVGAAQFVYGRVRELREAGCAILLSSVDLDELLEMADRIVVLFRGRVVLERRAEELGIAELAAAMAAGEVSTTAADN